MVVKKKKSREIHVRVGGGETFTLSQSWGKDLD